MSTFNLVYVNEVPPLQMNDWVHSPVRDSEGWKNFAPTPGMVIGYLKDVPDSGNPDEFTVTLEVEKRE